MAIEDRRRDVHWLLKRRCEVHIIHHLFPVGDTVEGSPPLVQLDSQLGSQLCAAHVCRDLEGHTNRCGDVEREIVLWCEATGVLQHFLNKAQRFLVISSIEIQHGFHCRRGNAQAFT
jgi:hypothetical protein